MSWFIFNSIVRIDEFYVLVIKFISWHQLKGLFKCCWLDYQILCDSKRRILIKFYCVGYQKLCVNNKKKDDQILWCWSLIILHFHQKEDWTDYIVYVSKNYLCTFLSNYAFLYKWCQTVYWSYTGKALYKDLVFVCRCLCSDQIRGWMIL